MIRTLFALTVAAFMTSASIAQETETAPAEKAVVTAAKKIVKEVSDVKVDKEGKLVGKAFAEVDGEEKPLEAKVTLSSNGVIVDSVDASEDGSFAFTNVEPGVYQMFGSADGFIGGSTYDVQPFSTGGCSSCNLGLQADTSVAYDTFSAAPCGSCGGGCGGCGGGIGSRFGGGGIGGGGGGLFGGGGGGLFGGSRLLRLGAIGGIVAIATTNNDDASPDE